MIEKFVNGNRDFVEGNFLDNQAYYHKISRQQKPSLLWIGCADSRVCPTTITNSQLGEIFVHRNIANIVSTGDTSISAVLEYAIGHLNILDVVVCGHYNCGGIQALDTGGNTPIIEKWLQPATEILDTVGDDVELSSKDRLKQLVEANVRLQVNRLTDFPIIKDINEKVRLHGWVYDLETGKLASVY